MSDSGQTAPGAVSADDPFVGLRYYAEADAEWFFGRDEERNTIIANLRAARLTVLYARSGVGKSSLVRAGVAAQLRELARRSAEQRGTPRYVPVVFGAWRDDPAGEVIEAIETAVAPFRATHESAPLPREGLAAAIAAASSQLDARLLIILDQFEDYLLYSAREHGERRFVDELSDCLNRADIRANFLLAIRDDAYAGLGDLFAGKITNVYGNHLPLDYLNRESAREAILGPIERFNELHPDEQPVEVEPALIDAVLDQVEAGEVVVGESGPPTQGNGARANGARSDEIETPYLQLVMSTLWRESTRDGSRVLRVSTLHELGNAQAIVRAHLEGALTSLAESDRETALELFAHLVTPSGAKIVHAASDLAAMIDRPREQVAGLLTRLASGDARIVRNVPPPAGRTQPDDRYEIFHDVLAPAILAWRQRALEQKRAAADALERRRLEDRARRAGEHARAEARRRRAFQRVAAGALALFGVAVLLGVLALLAQKSAVSNQKTAQSRQLAASSEAVLASDPELSTLLALAALRVRGTEQAEAALRDATPQLAVLQSLHAGSLLLGATFSHDGRLLLTAGADGRARVWDLASGRETLVLDAGRDLTGASFSADGRRVLTIGPEQGAVEWDAASGLRVRAIGARDAVEVAAISPNGLRIATAGSDRVVRLWDAASGRQLAALGSARLPVRSVVFNAAGTEVLTSSEDGAARVWPVAVGGRSALLRVRDEGIDGASFSPDGRRIVTAGIRGSARIFSFAGTQLTVLGGHTGTVYSAAFSPDGSEVVTGSEDGTARIWDATSGRPLRVLSGDGGIVRSATFSPDGATVATASDDGNARVWDATPRELVRTLFRGPVNSAAFSPVAASGSERVVTAGYDGAARVWSVPQDRELAVLRAGGRPLTSAAFSPDGRRVVTAGEDGLARVWSVASGAVLAVLGDRQAGALGLESAAFSADGRQVVTASEDGTARTWDAASARPIRTLGSETPYRMYSAAFSADGRKVVTASEDGTVALWDATDGAKLRAMNAHAGIVLSATFSTDGSKVLSADADGTARVWDAMSGAQLLVIGGHTGPISGAEYSDDGRWIVTAGADGTARIWDAADGKQLAVLSGELGRVNSAMFDPDGRYVVTASDDAAAVWSTELAGSVRSVERIAASRLKRGLTPAERRTYGVGS